MFSIRGAEQVALPKIPSLRIASMEFSDGTTLALEKGTVLLLVGPNNAGKSAALKQIQGQLAGETKGTVIQKIEVDLEGNQQEVERLVAARMERDEDYPEIYTGMGGRVWLRELPAFVRDKRGSASSVFVTNVSTKDRISGSDPVPACALDSGAAHFPLQRLFTEEALGRRLSKYFLEAFGVEMTPFYVGAHIGRCD